MATTVLLSMIWVGWSRARQDNIDELRKKRKMIRVGGVLSALGRRFNKLTAMVDPETADHISIVEDDGQQVLWVTAF